MFADRAAMRQDMTRWTTMCTAILELRAAGFTYREINDTLVLPYSSYRIMNGKRFKFLDAVGAFEEPAIAG